MNYIRILNDIWDDHNKIYKVVSYQSFPDTTGAKFILEHDNVISRRTICIHQVEWLETDES